MCLRRLMAVLALAGSLILFGPAAPVCAGDADGDGVDDAIDVCNNTPAGTAVDAEGRPLGDIDQDCDTDLEDYALFVQGFTGPLAPIALGMVLIPTGEFQMGDHHDGMSNAPLHTVTLSAFWMSKYEITNAQYAAFLNEAKRAGQVTVSSGVVSGWGNALCDTTTSSSYTRITYSGGVFGVVSGKESHPMVKVSWYGAKAFCDWYGYRLPTEAEWEYAARGGQHSPYYRFPWGDTIQHAQANYYSFWSGGAPYYPYDVSPTEGFHPTFNTGVYPYTSPVGYFAANGYGLYDMAGNVGDWCHDWYGSNYYSVSLSVDPQGPATGSYRVMRGGSWYNLAYYARCASRDYGAPSARSSPFGFRIALDF